MTRIHIICEGQTEEMFVKEVLMEAFLAKGFYLVPTLIGKPGHKGGNFKFGRLLIDLRARLLDDTAAYCTTFFDFYGLPEDFPGKSLARNKVGISEKSHCLMNALTERLRDKIGADPIRRFIPYVQMYEFEGLLFSHPERFAQGIDQVSLTDSFLEVRNKFSSPEEINDSPITAPSKRIAELYSAYEKPIHGSLGAMEIGLNIIRKECHLFDTWLKTLEAL